MLTEFFYVCGCIRKWSNEIRGEFVNYSVSNPYMYVSIVCALITYCVFSEWIIHTYMVQLNTLPYGGKFWGTLDFWKFLGILCWHTYLSIYSIDSAVLPKVYLSICIYMNSVLPYNMIGISSMSCYNTSISTLEGLISVIYWTPWCECMPLCWQCVV